MGVNTINTNIATVIEQTSVSSVNISKGAQNSNLPLAAEKVEDFNLAIKELNRVEVDDKENNLEQIEKSVDQLNKIVQSLDKKLNFSVDKNSGRVVVKVVERETNKVVRQIPPDEVLRLSAKIQEMIGMLLDEKS